MEVSPEGKVRRVLSSVWRGTLGRKAVVGAEVVKQPVRVKPEEVSEGSVLVVTPAAVGQCQGTELERMSEDSSFVARWWNHLRGDRAG